MYLRYFTSSHPKDWSKWLAWAEYCYNTSWHSTIKTTPFEVVYGRPPPTLLSYVPRTTSMESVDNQLMHMDMVLRDLKAVLLDAQSRMKKVYD